MNCTGYERRVYAELDGELGAEARAGLRAHLGGCESCRVAERRIGALRGALRFGRREEALPEGAESRIWAAAFSRSGVGLGADFPLPAPAQVFLVLVLALAIGISAGFFAASGKAQHPASLKEWRGLPQSTFSTTYSNLMGRTLPR